MWGDNQRSMARIVEVVEITETGCKTKVAKDGKTPHPTGRECAKSTKQAIVIAGLPGLGKRTVQMPNCEFHIKIYMGEAKSPTIMTNEGPRPGMAEPIVRTNTNLCPDCGQHPIGQTCRLGPRRI